MEIDLLSIIDNLVESFILQNEKSVNTNIIVSELIKHILTINNDLKTITLEKIE